MIELKESAEGTSLAVRVQPRASRNAIVGEMGGALKISLTTPPVEGRANEACVEFLAEVFSVSRSAVELFSGQTGRNKVFRIRGVKSAELRARLEKLLAKD